MSDLDLTPAAAVRAFSFGNSPTPAAPSPPTSTPTAAPPASAPPGPQGTMSAEHAKTMADWTRKDLDAGKISSEQAAKIFDDLGVPADQRVTPPDLRDEEQRLVDVHFPAAKPEEFSIRYADPGQALPQMTPELKAFDTTARAWLSQAEFPRELGNSLITQIEQVARTTKAMSADQLESYGLVEYAKLERVYGTELEDKLNTAGRMVEQLEKKTPGLKNLLRSKGLGDNAMVASLLIQQAERYWIRRKGR